MKPRHVLGMLVMLLGCLIPASTSLAAVGLPTVTAAPADTQAAAHSDFTIAFDVDGLGAIGAGGDDLSGFRLDLPTGMVGNPFVAPTCSPAQLDAAACPSASQVGETTTTSDISVSGLTLPNQAIHGEIYNMQVAGTESARLAIILRPVMPIINLPLAPVKLQSEIRVRTETAANGMAPGGLTSVTTGLPTKQATPLGAADVQIKRISLTLNGVVGGKSYLTNPALCSVPAASRVTVTTTAGASASKLTAYQPTGCAAVPFAPSLEVLSSSSASDSTTSVTTHVRLPATDDPSVLGSAQPAVAVVKLPEGFELTPSIGSAGLEGCSDAQFDHHHSTPAQCSDASQIGTVRFVSPLTAQPLEGKVWLSPAEAPALNRILIQAQESSSPDALRLKLVGVVTPDPQTGQVTTVLRDLPPLPFTDFELSFRGGDNAVFRTPRACGSFASQAALYPYTAPASPKAFGAATTISDCPDPEGFAPTVSVTPTNGQAGADTSLVTTIERGDRSSRLSSVQISLPPGLTGNLNAATQCPVETAKADGCGSESLVGSVRVLNGTGPTPLAVDGRVYLTEPIDGGLAGLAITVPARVGPLDLGNVVTLARITTRPDASLDITSAALPTRQRGVALDIRSLRITLDRPGLMRNATSCEPRTTTARIGGDRGQMVDVNHGYKAAGCGALPYSPAIGLTLGDAPGDLARGQHPKAVVRVTQATGQANNRQAVTTLPAGVASNLNRINKACSLEQYSAGSCGGEAVIGSASAVTPLLSQPLSGRVVMVKIPGKTLPALKIELRGQISLDLTAQTSIDSQGRLVTTLDGLPDNPISDFQLTVDGGPNGLLSIGSESLCTSKPVITGAFTAHSGASTTASGAAVLPAGCGAGAPATAPKTQVLVSRLSSKPKMRVIVRGQQLSAFSVTLPKGMSYQQSKRIRVRVGGVDGKAKVKIKGRRLLVTLPKGASSANVLVDNRSLRVTKSKSRSKARVAVKVAVSSAAPKVTKTVKVKQTRNVTPKK